MTSYRAKMKTEFHIYKNGNLVAIQDVTIYTVDEMKAVIALQKMQGRTVEIVSIQRKQLNLAENNFT